MGTAKDEIKGALHLLGVIAEGEEASAETMIDALDSLNIMIDGMALERLLISATQIQSLPWPAGEATRTIGPTGDIVGIRPMAVDGKSYYTVLGVNYPLLAISEWQYNDISLTIGSGYPEYMFVNMTAVNAEITLYPAPSTDILFKLSSIIELTQPAELTTVLLLPPGYRRMFRYNLAVEIAAMFGMEPSQSIFRIAIDSKKSIKRHNTSEVDMRMSLPSGLAGSRSNIFQG